MSIWITRLGDAPAGRRLAVKDLFDTKGVRTTYGSAVFADHVPDRTAAAVLALEGSGWANVGKSNLHEFAWGITSQNPHYGDVPNPTFPGRTAGGSSGGSAAAIAAGEADLGLGTDSGGSIRIPAACCELVGFKPTFGRVPMDGCFPLAASFDHVGPVASDVAGCAEAMRILSGVEPAVLDALDEVVAGVAWLEHTEAEVRGQVEAAAARFPRRSEIRLPIPDGLFPAFQFEIAEVHRELFGHHRDLYGDNVAAKIERALDIGEAEAAAASAARECYREAFEAALDGLDLAIAPTLPILPPAADRDDLEVREQMTLLTFPLNAVGAPALALPCGRSAEGLPVSIQVFARPGEDAMVLAAGRLLETALGHTAASNERHKHP